MCLSDCHFTLLFLLLYLPIYLIYQSLSLSLSFFLSSFSVSAFFPFPLSATSPIFPIFLPHFGPRIFSSIIRVFWSILSSDPDLLYLVPFYLQHNRRHYSSLFATFYLSSSAPPGTQDSFSPSSSFVLPTSAFGRGPKKSSVADYPQEKKNLKGMFCFLFFMNFIHSYVILDMMIISF